MAYAKARKRKYNNQTRLNNKARKQLKQEKRQAEFQDRKNWRLLFAENLSRVFNQNRGIA